MEVTFEELLVDGGWFGGVGQEMGGDCVDDEFAVV